MSIWSQKSASIQKRKSLIKFDDLAEKSQRDSVSNFRTKHDQGRRAQGTSSGDVKFSGGSRLMIQ